MYIYFTYLNENNLHVKFTHKVAISLYISVIHFFSVVTTAPFPEFMPFSDMDADARLAHSCTARGELIKRSQEKVSQQQEKLMNGLFFLR